ncbi:adenosine deaminase [Neokomagataea tanensis]|uniref:adenosine deaminase n=2 Tax=Neokomagataea TaxID=1223423 RepID=A0A4Y6VBW0_9PROT|nr:adenosine deaminase [Neokomagataea thailandica]QDH25986.1 adenosine deaminase [Neokomagataea tanensis]
MKNLKTSTLFFCALSLALVTDKGLAQTQKIEKIYNSIRHDPVQLGMFLQHFPKGADLHLHLSGAVYAESLIEWAAQDGMCFSTKTLDILGHPCTTGQTDEHPASALQNNELLRNIAIDALSMRDFVPDPIDRSGHDHFFATFEHFDALEKDHQGDMLAEVMDRAADNHITYIEPMISPALGKFIQEGFRHPLKGQDFSTAHQQLQPDISTLVNEAKSATDSMERKAHTLLKCGTPQAHPGCAVSVRYLYQTLRTLPPQAVYAQLEGGYALVKSDPRFVGINIVAPEDDAVALRDYSLHMAMFNYLNQIIPDVNLSLHAGELTDQLVPPEELKSHIRQAVEIAGAKRIGHGVDIAYESDADQLMLEMSKKHIMVEINLSSNEQILGIKGDFHPFRLYQKYNVPLSLSTDDEGVSRGNLTKEYTRAALTYNLDYADLKRLSRTGLEYAFLPGESLWQDHTIGKMIKACSADLLSPACRTFVRASDKASAQWSLERQFQAFESSFN